MTGECECDILKGVTSTARSPFFKGQGSHPTCHLILSFGKQFVRVLAEMNVLIFLIMVLRNGIHNKRFFLHLEDHYILLKHEVVCEGKPK